MVCEVDVFEADEAGVVGCCIGVGVGVGIGVGVGRIKADGPAWIGCMTGDASVDVGCKIHQVGKWARVDLHP